jgi:hypothetical protein
MWSIQPAGLKLNIVTAAVAASVVISDGSISPRNF